ncbi:MAG: hypothetical protein DYG89_46950 [Caldilinea sp. CFX5]|nr:hypothetical protein [Caldilinea sp. CFX5]
MTTATASRIVANRVWRDDNSNGIQDSGEPGVPGVTVQLKDCNNNVLRTATTDGNGNYSFTGLAAGCYRVGVVPNGFTISPVNQGTDDTRDSDVDPATAMTGNINLAQGENNPTVDAGLIPPQPNLGSIGDRVFNDTNRDGIQNAGEPGVPGVTVQLKDCNNNVLRTTATDNNGIYGFTGLAAGCYRIGILPNGFTISPANQGTDDTRDSDVDPATAMTGNINLAQGENNPTIDAGVFTPQPVGSIGDRVFDDLNSNGIQDNGEPGVPNVTVQLKDCNNNVLRTATTDGSGNYLFNNLNAGCYTVGVVLPIGREFTSANQGTDDARDSDIDPATGMTGPINLDPGENDLTNDAGLRAPLACGLTVDQKCQVAGPPPSSNFTCSDAKPLNELSMVWNGSQRVDVRAWKGSVGSTLLATITNVAPGQIVNVTGYAGAPNDVIWEVFAAGTTSKLGESTFHLSCSDRNMDGPEDCGTAQGDGKDRTGFLNSWKLEGMGGNGIRFTCSSTPPTPTDSCTVISSGGSVCNGSKPKSLTFRYTGGSCANSTNPQSGKATCSGSPGTGTVTIAATGKDASKISITPSSVNPGQEVTLTSTDGKGFPSDTRLQVGGQALAIHTSCSQALNLGDVFGSLVLVGADGKRLDTPVTFTYLVANSGDALSNVSLEDDFGSVTAPFSLARGASQSFQRQTTIGETTTNTAFVRGVLANGQQCEDSDDTTVVIEPPALSCQDGKPIALTFEYTGGSCSDTTNSQNGKLLCSGSPGTDPVSIAITGKDADKVAVRPSSVSRGQRFTMSRTDGREFAADTLLRVGGQSLSIHTSCSQQLNVGDVFGSLRLVVFTPKGFPIPASADGGANQTFLPLIARQ